VSPDELQQLRERRLAQVESDVAAVEARTAAQGELLAVHANTLENHDKQLEGLWRDSSKVRWMLLGAMVSVTTGSIAAAILVFIKAGGGAP